MNMKKIILFISLIFAWGCNDGFLDRSPYGSISSGNMWTTDDLTDKGVGGVYQVLNIVGMKSSAWGDIQLYQLDGYSFSSETRDAAPIMIGTITPSHSLFSSAWRTYYEGVHRANDAISKIQTISPSPEVKKARYIAECKFLRAYYYSRLNQLFKGVPIYLEPVENDDCTRGQESEEKVWEVIIQDLTDCINEPNLPNKYNKGDANYGHATKGAAYALRGKAYLYLEKWKEAAADFSKVKDCGYSLFQGGYKELFKEANEQCDEMIFSIQYVGESGFGCNTQVILGSRSVKGMGFAIYTASSRVVDLFEWKDGRAFSWDDAIPGYTQMDPRKREIYFLRDTANLSLEPASTQTFVRNQFKQKEDYLEMDKYIYNGNESRIKQIYEGRDPRLCASVITPYSSILGRVISGQEQTFTSRWPFTATTELPPTLDHYNIKTDNYRYYHRKFVYEGDSEIIDRVSCPTDFPIIRYADVLLMWAEALVELNDLDGAIELVNQVRQRSSVEMPPLQRTDTSKPTFVKDQTDLRNRVRNERRCEFINEGISFFDERRWKTWHKTVFSEGEGTKQIWGTNLWSNKWPGDHLYTWPVPTAEIEKNRNLTPTPGWSY